MPVSSSRCRRPRKSRRGDAPDPLLAIWRHGRGTAAAWTSDFAADWGRDWLAREKYRPFLNQLVTELARVKTKSELALSTLATAEQGVIIEDQAEEERLLDLRTL